MQKHFGATAKLADVLFTFVHHVSPHVKQKGPTYPWIPLLFFWVGAVCCGMIFLSFFLFFAFLGCLKIPGNNENIVKVREGLFFLLIKGDWRWCLRDRVYGESFSSHQSVSSHIISGYILHRLPYVGFGSKIEVMRAADRNLAHLEVKDMHMGHVYMLQICILIMSNCELFSSSAVGGAVAICI